MNDFIQSWHLIDALFIFLGAVTVLSAVRDWRRMGECASWPATAGTIVKSGMDRDSDGAAFAVVRYTYSVNGREHTGDRIRLGGDLYGPLSGTSPSRITARYPVGHEVTVYYDPFDPSAACLERKGMPAIAFTIVVGGVFLVYGIGGLLHSE